MRVVPEQEREEAAAMARDDFVAGRLTLVEMESEVEAALLGLANGACRYLSPFPKPRDPTKVERR